MALGGIPRLTQGEGMGSPPLKVKIALNVSDKVMLILVYKSSASLDPLGASIANSLLISRIVLIRAAISALCEPELR